ncbi:hypothetical protein SKAU_G00304780 [Synaphobranchus kaupii]|uniref:Uncharacterized protein n=1 Tax=Synaphobranchus kaupii TaxID=118154 RepID=A0A9Q1ILH6_SYNKA|nr:hypothetical protein SKAU_G00304780 [Synaphobranchus kaupii]
MLCFVLGDTVISTAYLLTHSSGGQGPPDSWGLSLRPLNSKRRYKYELNIIPTQGSTHCSKPLARRLRNGTDRPVQSQRLVPGVKLPHITREPRQLRGRMAIMTLCACGGGTMDLR